MDWDVIINYLLQLLTSWGIKLLKAIVVLIIALKLIGWVKKVLKKSPKLDKLDPGVRTFLSSFVSIGLYILLIIVMAGMIGIPATSFITILSRIIFPKSDFSCAIARGISEKQDA